MIVICDKIWHFLKSTFIASQPWIQLVLSSLLPVLHNQVTRPSGLTEVGWGVINLVIPFCYFLSLFQESWKHYWIENVSFLTDVTTAYLQRNLSNLNAMQKSEFINLQNTGMPNEWVNDQGLTTLTLRITGSRVLWFTYKISRKACKFIWASSPNPLACLSVYLHIISPYRPPCPLCNALSIDNCAMVLQFPYQPNFIW